MHGFTSPVFLLPVVHIPRLNVRTACEAEWCLALAIPAANERRLLHTQVYQAKLIPLADE